MTSILLSALLLIAAPLVSAQQSDSSPDLKTTYLRPGADLSDYTQFVLKPLDLENTRYIPPPWVDDADPRQWELGERNRQFLKGAFKQAMTRGLQESGEFNVVEQPFRGSLELEVELLSLSPYAHSEDEDVKTRGYGELTFEASLRDARSGELLGLFEGRQQVGEAYQENTQFNRGHNFAEHFYQWGRNVSQRMSAIHERE